MAAGKKTGAGFAARLALVEAWLPGEYDRACKAYGTYLLSSAVPAGLLVWSGYPARWWLVASVAAAVGLLAW